jgi:hypothetical protein
MTTFAGARANGDPACGAAADPGADCRGELDGDVSPRGHVERT